MFSTFITVALFVSLTIKGASAGFAINDPPLKQCTSAQISWSPGTPPYVVEVVSATDPCGAALRTIDGLMSTVYQYTTDLAPGTKVLLYVSDNAGDEAWSGNITIGSGSDSCTPGGSTSSTSSGSPPTVNPNAHASPTPTSAEVPPIAAPSSNPTGLGGAINVGGTSSGVLTVHGASTLLLSIMALVPVLALTLQ